MTSASIINGLIILQAHFVLMIQAQFLSTSIWDNKVTGGNALDGISSQCLEDLLLLERQLTTSKEEQNRTWADYMLDSYGQFSSSIFQGNHYWEGDFVECINLEVARNKTKNDQFYGQYCLLFLQMPQAYKTISIGTCSPSSCSAKDLQIFYGTNIDKFYFSLEVNEKFCQTKFNEITNMDQTTIFLSLLIGFFFLIAITATMYDLYNYKNEGKAAAWKTILLSFSIISNSKKIFEKSKNENEIAVLNGVRAITMSWVVIGHTAIMVVISYSWENGVMFRTYFGKLLSQVVFSSEYAVDSFLFISGYLVTYSLLSKLNSTGRFNYFWYLIHRLIRIWPSYLFVLILVSGPLPYLSTGPQAPGLIVDQQVCRRRWWQYPLFVDIYFNSDDKCLPQTWYLCLDWVFYACYPIIIYPLYKKPKIGYAVYCLFLVASFAIPGFLIYHFNLEPLPTYTASNQGRLDYNDLIYERPWGRMSPGLIGLAFAYIAYSMGKDKKFKMIAVYILWIASFILGVAIIYGTKSYIVGDKMMDIYLKTAIGTFARPAWTIALGWLLLASSYGYGSLINSILSWKGFLPISRLSYCTYLLHFNVIISISTGFKQLWYLDDNMLAYVIIFIFVTSVIAAGMLNILIEQPFIRLERLILK